MPDFHNTYANLTPASGSTLTDYNSHPPLAKMPGRVVLDPHRLADAVPSYAFSLGGDAAEETSGHLSAMQQPTMLSRAFFSAPNIQMLQNALRRGVYEATHTNVHEQSPDQLRLVMRSIFLQHSRNQTESADVVRAQIRELNEKVVTYCIPVVVSSLKQYQQYLVDISTMPTPMEYGLATSQAGSRSLEMKPFF